ncbi:hypothetical protein LCGC14_1980350, partial [marine sediment metagenome]
MPPMNAAQAKTIIIRFYTSQEQGGRASVPSPSG